MSTALLSAGYNIATLMSKYQAGVDWRNPENWACNDLVHPSRHGTYDHISMHPFETVFVKASWDVGQPHLDHYSDWLWKHAQVNMHLCSVWVDKAALGQLPKSIYSSQKFGQTGS